MKYYAPTKMLRVGLSQEARVVYAATDVPPGGYQRVLLAAPAEPTLYGGLDVEPEAVGPNRTYKLAPVPPYPITFTMLDGQFLVLATSNGIAAVMLVVEHVMEG